MGLDSAASRDVEENNDGEALNREQASKFWGIAATVNYAALDRPDLQFATSILRQRR